MSLVAYENSDSESEPSDFESRENGKVIIPPKQGLFVSLPVPNTPSGSTQVAEEDDEFLHKKEVSEEKPQKRKIKITVPSLSEFADDETDEELTKKKRKVLSKSSGLFSLLPPPKSQPITAKHFIPHSVKRKPIKKEPVKKPKVLQNKKPSSEELESDDEDLKEIPDTFDEDTWQKVCGRPKKVPKPVIEEVKAPSVVEVIEIAPEASAPYRGLDNEAFKELLGANGKRKRENINLIDINEDEILPDKDIWMAKSLTDPEMAAKYVIKDPVNDTCRRKHHITYLAQQAKANEQELQNQWSSNRFTRQKTQAKYGF